MALLAPPLLLLRRTKQEYSPGSSCIDTGRPFRVQVAFPVDTATGELAHIQATLSQGNCSVQTRRVGKGGGRHSYSDQQMGEISRALRKGMTPVFSHCEWGCWRVQHPAAGQAEEEAHRESLGLSAIVC